MAAVCALVKSAAAKSVVVFGPTFRTLKPLRPPALEEGLKALLLLSVPFTKLAHREPFLKLDFVSRHGKLLDTT